MSKTPSARVRALVSACALPLAVAMTVASACAPAQRPNGEACIKDQDCLSGICSGLLCAPTPTLLDAEVNGPGAPKEAAAPDAEEAGDDATGEDSSSDSGGDAPGDGAKSSDATGDATEGGDASRKEASSDAKQD